MNDVPSVSRTPGVGAFLDSHVVHWMPTAKPESTERSSLAGLK